MSDNPYQPPVTEQSSAASYRSFAGSDAMTLKRIGILSMGKVMGCLYAILGLLVGAFLSLISLAGFAAQGPDGAGAPVLVSIGAIFFLPIIYGAMGFLGGILMAALYNFIASFAGGVQFELTPTSGRGA